MNATALPSRLPRIIPLRQPWRDTLIVGAVAFMARLIHVWGVADTPFLEGPVIDALQYRMRAASLVQTGSLGGPFFQPPLYQVFLAGLMILGLGSPWAVAGVHALLGTATTILTMRTAVHLANEVLPTRARAVGLLCGLATALYGPLILFDIEALPPALVHLLAAGAWLMAARSAPGDSRWRRVLVASAVGGLIGLATTGWGLMLATLPAIALLLWRASYRWSLSILLVAFLCPVALVWLHNVSRDPTMKTSLVSSNAGLNLYIGNNPQWRRTWKARPGAEWNEIVALPEPDGRLAPGEKSAFYVEQVRSDVAARPLSAVGRTLEKLYYVWHGREIRRNQDVETLREASPLLRVLQWEGVVFFPFGLVAPLALLGAWRWRRTRICSSLILAAGTYSLAVAAFFVASRYRLPLALMLLPIASSQLVSMIASRPQRREIAALVLLLVLCNLPNAFTAGFRADEVQRALLRANAFLAQGQPQIAIRVLEDLLATPRDRAIPYTMAADLLVKHKDDCDGARQYLLRARQLAPDYTAVGLLEATCAIRTGSLDSAREAFARVLDVSPSNRQALQGLAKVERLAGNNAAAIQRLEQYLAVWKFDPGPRLTLATLLLSEGRPQEALAVLEGFPADQRDRLEVRMLMDDAREQLATDRQRP